MWSTASRVFVEEGAEVTGTARGYVSGSPSGLVTVNGGSLKGTVSVYNSTGRYAPQVEVNEGTVDLDIQYLDNTADNPIYVAVKAGETTATSVDDRRLTIAEGAVLTIATTNGYAVAFDQPIAGEGTLRFAEGAKIDFLGDLVVVPQSKAWKTFATVGAIEGLPSVPGLEFRVVAANDASSLQYRRPLGTMLIIR